MPNLSRIKAPASPGTEKPTRDRIVEAAYRVFKRYDIDKATMDGIAREAKLSRATIYKHFESKDALLHHISEINLRRIHQEILESVSHARGFADRLTEALLVAVKIAQKDIYTRRVFDSMENASRSINPRYSDYKLTRESWRPFLERARENAELAKDLDLDDVVTWLTASLMTMYIRLTTLKLKDSQIRAYFSRFVVRPLLADPHSHAPSPNKP